MPGERSGTKRTGKPRRTDELFLENYLSQGVISPSDMKLAMKKAMEENDPLKRAALFSALLHQLTPENAKEAFLALKDSRSGRRRFGGGGDEMRMLLNAWGRVDGEGVMAELTALRDAAAGEDGEGNGRGGRGGRGGGPRGGRGGPGGFGATGDGGGIDFMSALSGWATTDVEAAAAYVNSIDDERRGRFYTAGLIQGVMVNGAEAAMDFIAELPQDNEMRGRYTSMVAAEMLEQGVDSARAWAEGID